MFVDESDKTDLKNAKQIWTTKKVWTKFHVVCALSGKKQGEALEMLCDFYMKHNPPPVSTRFSV